MSKKAQKCSHKNLHVTVHDSIIHNSEKVEKTYPSINEWINKMWSIYAMVYYLPMKKNKVLIPHG